jgi:hypothetical protein
VIVSFRAVRLSEGFVLQKLATLRPRNVPDSRGVGRPLRVLSATTAPGLLG